jgi:sulfatase modifying factor 1
MRSARYLLFGALGAVSAFAGLSCQVIGGFSDFTSAGVASGGVGGSAGNAATAGGPCSGVSDPGKEPPKMLPIARGAECRFIDQTEVTVGEYQNFLAVAPADRPPASDVCSWKTGTAGATGDPLEPDAACLSATDGGDTDGALPVACVDWCDAEAYCTWAGKRLCEGSYGGANFKDPAKSIWYDACASAAGTAYPYGSSYDSAACNGADHPGCSGACDLVPAGSLTGCLDPEGVSDLSGNVAEWVNECDSVVGATDECYVRGGSVNDSGNNLRCDSVVSHVRSFTSRFVGFRCCDL